MSKTIDEWLRQFQPGARVAIYEDIQAVRDNCPLWDGADVRVLDADMRGLLLLIGGQVKVFWMWCPTFIVSVIAD